MPTRARPLSKLVIPDPEVSNTYLRRNTDNTAYEAKTPAEVLADIGAAPAVEYTNIIQYQYTATDGQTAFTGVDDNGLTLAYTAGYELVFLNGVKLEAEDYIHTDSSTITLNESTVAGDVLVMIVFSPLIIADTYTQAETDSTFVKLAELLTQVKNVDGAGSGLDADLLDGQEGAYYLPATNYTAADVLTKLLTVDGSGSGLDADTVDGIQAAGLLKTYNMYDASGHTLPSQTPSPPGWYTGMWLNNTTGAPEGMTYGRILGYTDSSNLYGYSFQIARGHSGAYIYLRVANNSAWSNWQRIVTHDPTEDPWIAPTFGNGWLNYGGGYNPAGYYKDKQGRVHLRGLIRAGTIGTTAFTLPSGYRPPYTELRDVISNSVQGRVDVNPSGTITISSPSDANWVSLDGISFRAA